MLTWDFDPILRFGPRQLHIYGLVFALTAIGGFFLFRWQMRRAGHPDRVIGPFMGYGLMGLIVGARLGHCLFYDLQRSIESPLFVLAIWLGGFSSHGATLGLVLALLLYARHYRLPLTDITDRFSFSAALGATTVRVANFLNSEIVGRPTDGSWGVRFPRHDSQLPLAQVPLRHPSQLYEAALGLTILALLLLLDRIKGEKRPRGLLSALFLLLYFSGRLALEQFKAHQVLASSSWFTMGQLLSVPGIVVGALWLVRLRRRG